MIKKKGKSVICSNMGYPKGHHVSEISQAQRDKYCLISPYLESKTDNLIGGGKWW
jgi:hypothetical protein